MLLHKVAEATTKKLQLSSFVEFSYPRPQQVQKYTQTSETQVSHVHVVTAIVAVNTLYMYIIDMYMYTP